MRESQSSPPVAHLQHRSSIRLRKRRDDVHQQNMKKRHSEQFGYRLSRDAVDNTDNADHVLTKYKVDTLDPGPVGGVHHNLRTLLRNKDKIKHFGRIDQPTENKR